MTRISRCRSPSVIRYGNISAFSVSDFQKLRPKHRGSDRDTAKPTSVPIARKIDNASKMILIKLMERQLVISSELHSVGYDDASNVLEVQFQTGGVYRYFGVPPNVHAALLAAESKGRFFNTVIKPRYQYQRIG